MGFVPQLVEDCFVSSSSLKYAAVSKPVICVWEGPPCKAAPNEIQDWQTHRMKCIQARIYFNQGRFKTVVTQMLC